MSRVEHIGGAVSMTHRIERIGGAELHCCDCRDVLPTLGHVDAVVTDPPYGIGENSKRVASRGNATAVRDYGDFNWDREPCPVETIDAMRSCSRWQIIFGGNFFSLPPASCWLVWDKLNTGDFADCELAWTNLPKAVRRIQWRWNGMIRRGDDKREHPTQKPVGVMSWVIEQLPPEARSVIDPFMGSGTTGVACARLGRQFIGVEIDPGYFDIACKRIENAYKQKDLFVNIPVVSKLVQGALL
jgi:DNA modification methylase